VEKARFQAWHVKIRKIAANSIPNQLCWKIAMKKNIAAGKKPRIGTD
jgi:hypothetical protein